MIECDKHGTVRGRKKSSQNKLLCSKCYNHYMTELRRKRRADLVALYGGKCVLCGYDKCIRALCFHHLDPTTKVRSLAEYDMGWSIASILAEAEKCVLLCSNCHMEVEAGVTMVPRGIKVVQRGELPLDLLDEKRPLNKYPKSQNCLKPTFEIRP